MALEKPTPHIAFDGFNQWCSPEGPEAGHYMGILWALNKHGDRIEVEVHIDSKNYPPDLMSGDWGIKAKYCKDKLQESCMELLKKVEESEVTT